MNSIRSKVLTLIISSIVIVALLASFLVMSRTLMTYEIEIEEELLIQAMNNGMHFDQEIKDVEKTAESLERLVSNLMDLNAYRENPEYIHEFLEVIEPMIKRTAIEMSQSLSAYVFFGPEVYEYSHDVWYADLKKIGVPIRQEEISASYYDTVTHSKDWYFVPKRTLEPYWTKPYDGHLDFDTNVIFVSYTRPLVIDHQFLGIVGSDYYYEDLLKTIKNYGFSDTGSAMLFNENGEIIIQPENSMFQNGHVDFWLKQKLLYNKEGIIDVGSDNQWYLSFTKLRNDWIYGEMVHKEELLKWYYDLNWVLVACLMVLIGIIILVSIKTVKLIVDPLLQLTTTVGIISRGDYDVKLDKQLLLKGDETGHLARSIEKLRLIQKNNYQILKEQNASLESEVEERTERLVESHEMLELSLEYNSLEKKKLIELNKTLEKAIRNMKHTQFHLIESEKLASLSLITTKMSHEFNTPLGSFLTLLTYLKKEKDKVIMAVEEKELSQKHAEKFVKHFNKCYGMIYEQLEELSSIIDRFKELDTLEKSLNQIQMNVKEYIRFILESLPYYNQLDVELNCPNDLVIEVDSGKFSQIIIQIVDNAYFHAYEKKDTKISIDVYHDKQLEIQIRDYGKGISNEQMNDIFLPYHTHQLNAIGSGLGLSIVYNIVTKFFDGHINCESSNHGTLFHIAIHVE